MPRFGKTSMQRLEGVHPLLVDWCFEVVTVIDCSVTYGVRTVAEQRHMVHIGASMTMDSLHLVQPNGYACAVDLAPYPIDWDNLYRFHELGGVGLAIAHKMGIPVEWGGHWKKLLDYGHFQLRRNAIATLRSA